MEIRVNLFIGNRKFKTVVLCGFGFGFAGFGGFGSFGDLRIRCSWPAAQYSCYEEAGGGEGIGEGRKAVNRILENVTQEQLVQPSALLNLSSSTFVLFYFSISVFSFNGFVFLALKNVI